MPGATENQLQWGREHGLDLSECSIQEADKRIRQKVNELAIEKAQQMGLQNGVWVVCTYDREKIGTVSKIIHPEPGRRGDGANVVSVQWTRPRKFHTSEKPASLEVIDPQPDLS